LGRAHSVRLAFAVSIDALAARLQPPAVSCRGRS
jgi:hypothetical protein